MWNGSIPRGIELGWSSLKLHDVIKAGITRHGIHNVSTSWSLSSVCQWNGVIPGPFYSGIPLLTIVYRGKPLSFSTRVVVFK